MSTAKTAGLSLADLDTRKASDTPAEIEYLLPDGSGSGVFISVLGSQSERVTSEINRLINDRRKKEAVIAARTAGSRPGSAEFTPVEDDVAFGQRLAAVRICGWRGITEEYTADRALLLCQTNAELSRQVLEASNDLGLFTNRSPAK